MKNVLLLVFTACLNTLLLFPASTYASSQDKVYIFGVVPQFDALRTHAIWRPILDELQQRTGLKFILKESTAIPIFEQEFGQGSFDFAYMNPYHIILANEAQGYQPIARDTGKELYGIVVVHKDSPIQKIEDLHGKQVAFPAPNALGASLLPRSVFLNTYNITIKPKYVNTHTSVYLNVATGSTDAGGGVQKTLSQQRPEVRDSVRVLYETQRVAAHPICAHSRINQEVFNKVQKALLAIGSTDKGKALLAKIPMKKIGPATMFDYAPIRELGLESIYQ